MPPPPGLYATLSTNFSRRCFSAVSGIPRDAASFLAPTSRMRTALAVPPATASSSLSAPAAPVGANARLQVSDGGMSVNCSGGWEGPLMSRSPRHGVLHVHDDDTRQSGGQALGFGLIA